MSRHWACAVLAATALATLAGAQAAPDLLLVGGRVFTGVNAQPWAEALAVRGDRISAVGSSAALRITAGPATRVIELGGRLVVPGLNDAHTHPGAIPPVTRLDGPPAVVHDPAFAEIRERLKSAVVRAPKDSWIFGEIGAAVLDDPEATRFALDAIAPDRLVMLEAWTGHGTIFNTAALKHLGVSDDEADPPGGFYGRMPGSKTISGVVHEYAEYQLRQRVTLEPPPDAQLAAFRGFATAAADFGITSLQGMMSSMPAAQAEALLANADLPVRIRLIDFPVNDMKEWRAAARPPSASARIIRSGTKWVLDGTPVERLMFLRDPYADQNSRGRANFSTSDLTQFLNRAGAAGEQPMIHAVGDAAVDMVLGALDATGGEAWRALRPRIEHGDMLAADQFSRARRLGVVVVQNPAHFMIAEIFRARIGAARMAQSQVVKSMVAADVPLALGSDGPLNPFLNLMFATIHADNPAEALTREQAVVAYTRGSAYAEFQETSKGTLAPGMLADVAVLSQDIFTVPAQPLPSTTSVLTIVGGRVVHEVK